jgi:hypothetical protein
MTAAALYETCLTLPWATLLDELAALEALSPAEVKAAYDALDFATPFQSKRQAIERIRRRVIERKSTHDRVRLALNQT